MSTGGPRATWREYGPAALAQIPAGGPSGGTAVASDCASRPYHVNLIGYAAVARKNSLRPNRRRAHGPSRKSESAAPVLADRTCHGRPAQMTRARTRTADGGAPGRRTNRVCRPVITETPSRYGPGDAGSHIYLEVDGDRRSVPRRRMGLVTSGDCHDVHRATRTVAL